MTMKPLLIAAVAGALRRAAIRAAGLARLLLVCVGDVGVGDRNAGLLHVRDVGEGLSGVDAPKARKAGGRR